MTLTLTQKIGKWKCYRKIVVYKLRIIVEKDEGTENLSHEKRTFRKALGHININYKGQIKGQEQQCQTMLFIKSLFIS